MAGQKQETDSLVKMQKAALKAQKDSLISDKRNRLNKTSEKYKGNLSSKTDSSARAVYKNKLNSKIDSSARAGIKNQVFQKAQAPVDKIKKTSGNTWKQVKSKIPPRKDIIKLSVEVRSESYYTTVQNPLLRSEPMYSRLYFSPTVTLCGLPFKANFFLTTENNNTYKNNFFSIRFDANAMRQKAMADMQKQLDEAKKLDRLRQVDIQKNILESQRYEQELDKLKHQVPDADALKEELEKRAKEKSQEFLDKKKAELQERLENATEEEKQKLEREFREKQDSVINHYKQQASDSLMSAKGKASNNIDTAKLGKYLRLQSKLDELKANKQKLENLRQQDSAMIAGKVSGMRNPDDIRAMAKDRMPGNKFLNAVLAVDRFGIGVVNPQYSEFTLYAASVKGLDIGINKQNSFYDVTIGKMNRNMAGPFSDVKPKYDRYMGMFRMGYGELKGDHLSVEYLYAFDPDSDDKTRPHIQNGVINLNTQLTLLKHTKIEADAAQSNYREKYVQQGRNYASSDKVLDESANRAYKAKITQQLNDKVKIEALVRQTGAAFRSAGNPFLRRNFREMELKYEQQLFKKKVKISGFYKEMRDNLVELNKATNRLKGYGLKLSTSFEKYPNLTLSYSPYQQGNNHPDSLYRTSNQFSITNAMITYKRRFRILNWNGLVNYTRSAMEINERGTVTYQLISTVHTLQVGQRHTGIISYFSNITAPFVDSLNSNSVQLNYNYLAKKTLSIGTVGEYTAYKNGAFKSGGGFQLTTTLMKNLTAGILVRYDRIHKLWHLDDADVFTGKVVVGWRW